jgi:sulfur carrier protein ThiS
MQHITIKFGQPLSQSIGQRRITMDLPDHSSVADLLTLLAQRYPGFDQSFRGKALNRHAPYIFFLNGRPVTPPNYDITVLNDGDVVHLVLPVVGGSNG